MASSRAQDVSPMAFDSPLVSGLAGLRKAARGQNKKGGRTCVYMRVGIYIGRMPCTHTLWMSLGPAHLLALSGDGPVHSLSHQPGVA